MHGFPPISSGDKVKVGVGEGVGLGLGLGDGVGVGEGVGLGLGLGVGVGEGKSDLLELGAGLGTGDLIATPLFQISFIPDLIHVYLMPAEFEVTPSLLHVAPGFGAAEAIGGMIASTKETNSRTWCLVRIAPL